MGWGYGIKGDLIGFRRAGAHPRGPGTGHPAMAASNNTEQNMPNDVGGGQDHSPEIPQLDLRGLKCPMPVLRTRKALRALPPGAELRVLCTDPFAAIDLANLARETGDAFLGSREGTAWTELTLRRSG